MKKINILKKIPIFSRLSEAEMRNIIAVSSVVRFKNREIIFVENSPGDVLYIILRGKVLIYKTTEEGKKKTLAILSESDFFGEMSILSPAPRSASAKALGNVELLQLYAQDFHRILKDNYQTSLKIIDTLCNRLRSTNKQVEILSYQNVSKRIIQMLLGLADTEEIVRSRIKIKITQKELAEMVATAREVVNRTLQMMKKRGILKIRKGLIEILDIKRLQEFNFDRRPRGES
ncbi:MAG: Crp/Fnr family transcriptional regulator [Elusimicrobia bacterium]|nr:Crp/Fnr family transcriptional regulator [Elusimicrobiota bacterium]